jgi:hypothetical protein
MRVCFVDRRFRNPARRLRKPPRAFMRAARSFGRAPRPPGQTPRCLCRATGSVERAPRIVWNETLRIGSAALRMKRPSRLTRRVPRALWMVSRIVERAPRLSWGAPRSFRRATVVIREAAFLFGGALVLEGRVSRRKRRGGFWKRTASRRRIPASLLERRGARRIRRTALPVDEVSFADRRAPFLSRRAAFLEEPATFRKAEAARSVVHASGRHVEASRVQRSGAFREELGRLT